MRAFITGCNGGLGREILKRFISLGYDTIGCFRTEDSEFINKIEALTKSNDVSFERFRFNFNSEQGLNDCCEFINNYDHNIDVLVNCAGINIMKPLFYTDLEDLQTIFMINYFAPVMITKAVANKMMMQGSGSIINISSIGSLGEQPGGTCYDASKAALNQFTKTIAQELAPFNIRANAIAPGSVNTTMFQNFSEKIKKNQIRNIALKRPAETAEIADLIEFLSSDRASFITGQIIRIDGGSII